jgi:uncharacterized DUF497 family protein
VTDALPLAALHSFAVPQRVRLSRAPCHRGASAPSVRDRICEVGHLVVVHTLREKNVIRIISARKATRHEANQYESRLR